MHDPLRLADELERLSREWFRPDSPMGRLTLAASRRLRLDAAFFMVHEVDVETADGISAIMVK